MSAANDLPGFEVPLHRSLTEPILLGGAPRTVAIANGTLAAAVGLGLQLWIPGAVLWIVGHSLAVWGARVDPQFMQASPAAPRRPAVVVGTTQVIQGVGLLCTPLRPRTVCKLTMAPVLICRAASAMLGVEGERMFKKMPLRTGVSSPVLLQI